MRLPKGYDTPLGQRGRNISLGQRQLLLSFARALVINPQDPHSRRGDGEHRSVHRARNPAGAEGALLAGRTCLVIAHRLATVRDADDIIVLQQGRIVEQGPHDDLMAKGGLYANLYASSHGSFDDLPGEGEDRADRELALQT